MPWPHGDTRAMGPTDSEVEEALSSFAANGVEKRHRRDLAAALDRDRRSYPERAELERLLAEVPARAKSPRAKAT